MRANSGTPRRVKLEHDCMGGLSCTAGWRYTVEETPEVLHRAKEITGRGVQPTDSLHIACALAAGCAFFLTTDDLIVKKMRGYSGVAVMDPTQFVIEVQ